MFFQETTLFPSGGESNFRIPSLIVTNNGTVIAFCNDRHGTLKDHADEVDLVCAVKKPGEAWSNVRVLAHVDGWACKIGSAVHDPAVDQTIIFFERNPVTKNEFGKYTPEELEEMNRRRAEIIREAAARGVMGGSRRMVSRDNGETFTEEAHEVEPVLQKHWDGSEAMVRGGTHGANHGICLRHGEHAGRLLCPSRVAIGTYQDWATLPKCVYNNSIYSDDHGKTWKASGCVQVGTGEGTLIERGDGSILYNSRAYFKDGLRYLAISRDGGETYGEFAQDPFLREELRMGCNASFLRVEKEDIRNPEILPEGAQDVTLFCNPRSETRSRITACVSFNGGETYTEARVIHPGPGAYSSLDYDKHSGHFFLLYEKGDAEVGPLPYTVGISVAEFDLEWLLQELK